MYIHDLSLVNFKNYDNLEISFSDKLNCFTGNNGVGKTNILDAIYYLSFCKSFFYSSDKLSINHNSNLFVVQGNYLINNQKENIYCAYESEKKKKFKRNKKEYDRLAEHIGLIPLVMISPTDINLIIGGSDQRRKFIDGIISQYNTNYLYDLQKYNKTLQQRNNLLRNKQSSYDDMLDVYDIQLAELGTSIFNERTKFIDDVIDIFQKYFNKISQGNEQVCLNYKSALQQDDLAHLLATNRSKDKILQTTTQGIHKDDLEFLLGDSLMRKIGSQGQKKTYLVALKMAQFEYIFNICKQKPILLLDDIFDKLDNQRVEQIIKMVSEHNFGQIFITDTNPNRIDKLLNNCDSNFVHFYIENNKATLLNSKQ